MLSKFELQGFSSIKYIDGHGRRDAILYLDNLYEKSHEKKYAIRPLLRA